MIKKCIVLLICLSSFFTFYLFAEDDNQKIYNKAIENERNGNLLNAIKYYEEYKTKITDNNEIERIELKIARITPLDGALKKYEDFLEKYKDSDLKLLVRYELANLHKLKSDYNTAINEYRVLSTLSEGTVYWQKSIINIAVLEFKSGNYDSAKNELSKVMKNLNDYEDSGQVYYLSGKIMFAKGMYKDAEKYFLICAGSYPQSSKGASSLLELVKIYILMGKYNEAERIKKMLNNLYPDSAEGYKVDDLLEKIKSNNKNKKHLEIELINLNKDVDINSQSLILLQTDLRNSLNNVSGNENYVSDIECGYYIQLGYLSSEENAKTMVDVFKKKNVNDIYYAKTKSSDTSKIYYRVLLGPYNEKKEANYKLIELKEKNIESIILELCKYYE